jgi:hypothetical protein
VRQQQRGEVAFWGCAERRYRAEKRQTTIVKKEKKLQYE